MTLPTPMATRCLPARVNAFALVTMILLTGPIACRSRPADGDAAADRGALPELPIAFGRETPPSGQQAVAAGWPATFGDPVLDELIREAQANNPNLQRAFAAWQEAQARTRVARSLLRPSLDGQAAYVRTDDGIDPDPRSVPQIGVVASWELDVWGRLDADAKAAGLTALATGLDYAYARQSLAASLANAWFTATEARARLKIAQDLLEVQQLTAEISRSRATVGAGVALDAEIAEANLSLARDSVEDARRASEESIRAVELLLGRYPSAELAVESDLPAMPEPVAVGVPSELLERRPDVVAADRRVAAAFYRIDSAKAAKLPRVTLTGSLGALLDPTESIWQIGANLLAPLYEGGRLDAQVQISEAQQQQALAGFVSVGLNAFAEVERALAAEHYFIQRAELLSDADERLRRASDIAQQRYEAGVITILDLTQVRQQYFAARGDLLTVRSRLLQQRVNLYLALGGSFDQEPAVSPAFADATPNPSTPSHPETQP